MKLIRIVCFRRQMPLVMGLLVLTAISASAILSARAADLAADAAPPSDPAAQFRAFLSSAYSLDHRSIWIKKIVYRLSNEDRKAVIGGANGGPRREFTYPGFSDFEASIQPHGFYLKYLKSPFAYNTNYNGQPMPFDPQPGHEIVYGADEHDFWCLNAQHDDIGISPRPSFPGATPKNYVTMLVTLLIRNKDLDPALYLGLDKLIGSNIRWTDATHFVADSQGTRTGHGQALKFSASGQPLIVRYEVTGKPKGGFYFYPTSNFGWYTVEYNYRADRSFPPFEMRRWKEGSARRFSDFIDSCEFGVKNSAAEGYKLSNFMSSADNVKLITISSNGIDYKLEKDGRLALLNAVTPPGIASAKNRSGHAVSAIFEITIALGLACAGWALYSKLNKTNK